LLLETETHTVVVLLCCSTELSSGW